jgi:hypothetical protein
MPLRYDPKNLKPYSLELYGPGGPEDLIWKVDSADPFTPMSRGERILPMDAPGARPDLVYEIAEVEHLVWTAGERVRYVTRIYARPAPPLA